MAVRVRDNLRLVASQVSSRHCILVIRPVEALTEWAPATGVITGEQLHKATGIASEACCWAGAATAAGGAGAGGGPGAAGVAAPASSRSASRRRDGSRTIARMKP